MACHAQVEFPAAQPIEQSLERRFMIRESEALIGQRWRERHPRP